MNNNKLNFRSNQSEKERKRLYYMKEQISAVCSWDQQLKFLS